MEEDVVNALLADSGVAAIVADRITWAVRPQAEALPAVVLHRITAGRHYTHEGRNGLEGPLIQIDCWGSNHGAAKRLARAVIAALDTLTTSPFQAAFVEGERDDNEWGEGPDATGAAGFFRTSLDVRVWLTT